MNLHRLLAPAALAAATLSCGIVPAEADGYYRPRPVYSAPALISWTGFYFGAHMGAGWSDVNWADVSLTGDRVNNDSSGFLGGGQIGYNQQIGNIVLGVEASLSGADLRDRSRSAVNSAVSYGTDINTIATVTGRLGLAGDSWLLYGKAGWAGSQLDLNGRNSAGPDRFAIDDWRNGWTVGGGLEFKVAPNMSLGVEYSYVDLGSRSYAGTTASAVPFTIRDHDVQVQTVTARLNFQFYRDEYRGDTYRPMK